jgi:hypothetical protein
MQSTHAGIYRTDALSSMTLNWRELPHNDRLKLRERLKICERHEKHERLEKHELGIMHAHSKMSMDC